MIEKRKEDSETVGKFQGLLQAVIMASLIVWLAPIIIPFITTGNLDGDFMNPNINGTQIVPSAIVDRVGGLWQLGLWAVRIILVVIVVFAATMLHYKK